jgi:hypothetical protein
MIAERGHPSDPGRLVFVALRKGPGRTWEPVEGHAKIYHDELEAGRVCTDDFAERYRAIVLDARILRALCEHPEFVFYGEGIDGDTVRQQAQTLESLVSAEEQSACRLLDEPEARDVVRLDDMLFRANEDGILVVCPEQSPELLRDTDQREAWMESPETIMEVMLRVAVMFIEQETGQTVDREAVKRAISEMCGKERGSS